MPAENPPRWITIHKVPYDFEHSRTSVTCYSQPGEFLVPARVADDAVAKGYASEGRLPELNTRSRKSGPARRRSATRAKKSATTAIDGAGTNLGTGAGMGGTGVAAAHRAVAGQPLADSPE